jgi:hypothetical protein
MDLEVVGGGDNEACNEGVIGGGDDAAAMVATTPPQAFAQTLGLSCSKCLHLPRKSTALTLQGVNTAEAQIRQILHHDVASFNIATATRFDNFIKFAGARDCGGNCQ